MHFRLLACPLFLVFLVFLSSRLRNDEHGAWSGLLTVSGVIFVNALAVTAITRGLIARVGAVVG